MFDQACVIADVYVVRRLRILYMFYITGIPRSIKNKDTLKTTTISQKWDSYMVCR